MYDRNQMLSFRLKQIGSAFIVIASLLAASVSACTCSHHSIAAKPAVHSCHGMAEEMAPEKDVAASDANAFETDCECAAHTAGPLFLAKSTGEKIRFQKDVSASVPVIFDTARIDVSFFAAVAPVYPERAFYDRHFRVFAPSRAPPRL